MIALCFKLMHSQRSFGDIDSRTLNATSWLADNAELILELPHLKKLHLPIVCPQHQPVLGNPRQAEVVGRFCLHEGKLLEVALAVTIQLEELLPCYADLSVVLWIEGNLKEIKNYVNAMELLNSGTITREAITAVASRRTC